MVDSIILREEMGRAFPSQKNLETEEYEPRMVGNVELLRAAPKSVIKDGKSIEEAAQSFYNTTGIQQRPLCLDLKVLAQFGILKKDNSFSISDQLRLPFDFTELLEYNLGFQPKKGNLHTGLVRVEEIMTQMLIPDEYLGAKAAEEMLRKIALHDSERPNMFGLIQMVDAMYVSNSTSERPFPNIASMVASYFTGQKFKSVYTGPDLAARNDVCNGFIRILKDAYNELRLTDKKRIALVSTEAFDRLVNPRDFNSLMLFSCAAGAVCVEKVQTNEPYGILNVQTFVNPTGVNVLSARPENLNKIYVHGKSTFTYFRKAVPNAARAVLDDTNKHYKFHRKNDRIMVEKLKQPRELPKSLQEYDSSFITFDDISAVLMHQANGGMLKVTGNSFGVGADRNYIDMSYGNSSSATIPVALYDLFQGKTVTHNFKNGDKVNELTQITYQKPKHGDFILLLGLGAGIGYGGALIRHYSIPR